MHHVVLALDKWQVEAMLDVEKAELLLKELLGIVRRFSTKRIFFVKASHSHDRVYKINGESVLFFNLLWIILVFVLTKIHLVFAIKLSDL